MCYIMNVFESAVVEVAPSVLVHNNFSLFLTPVNIECINFISLPWTIINIFIVRTTIPPFFKGRSKFWLPPPEVGRGIIWKFKKSGWKYGAGKGLLKRRGLTPFLFIFFKVYHFYICKLLYPLQNCVLHLKKNYFFLSP